MRIGLMIGPERGRSARRSRSSSPTRVAAEDAGFTSIWVPQLPGDFDALTAVALMGAATTRVELGTAVVPIQTRHPVAMAQQALSNQAVCEGRFTLGHRTVAPLDRRGHARAGVRPAGAPGARLRRGADAAFGGPGPVDVENDTFRVHNPLDVTDLAPTPDPPRRPRTGDAAPRRRARVGHDPLDGRRAGDRRLRGPPDHEGGGGVRAAPARGSWPGSRWRCARTTTSTRRGAGRTRRSGHAEYSPNYQRLLEHGDATDVGDLLVAGDESAVVAGLRSFRDAGVTDLAVRLLPLGSDREARIASRRRTEALLASLCPEL